MLWEVPKLIYLEFIPVLKIYTIRILGRFVRSTHFVQRDLNKYTKKGKLGNKTDQ